METIRAGDDHVPGERSTSEYSQLAIAIAKNNDKLRVDHNGFGWIHDMEPDFKMCPICKVCVELSSYSKHLVECRSLESYKRLKDK